MTQREAPGYLIWTGGEPFSSFDSLQRGISLGAKYRCKSEILTSGIWFIQNPDLLNQLIQAGPFSLRLSIDPEHQDKIPLKAVIDLTNTALQMGIKTDFTLRDIPHRSNKPYYYIRALKKHIPQLDQLPCRNSRQFHLIPHIMVNAPAQVNSSITNSIPGNSWKKPCYQGFKDLIIGPDKKLYPCCGFFGFDHYKKFSVMNLADFSIDSYKNKIDHSPLYHTIKNRGIYYIGKQLKIKEVLMNNTLYKTPCDLCSVILRKYFTLITANYPLF